MWWLIAVWYQSIADTAWYQKMKASGPHSTDVVVLGPVVCLAVQSSNRTATSRLLHRGDNLSNMCTNSTEVLSLKYSIQWVNQQLTHWSCLPATPYLTSVSEGVFLPRRSWYNHIPSAAAESNLGHLKTTNLTACCSFSGSTFPSPALEFADGSCHTAGARCLLQLSLAEVYPSILFTVKWSPVVLSVHFLSSVVPKVLASLLLGKPENICVCPVSLQMRWLPSPRTSSHLSHLPHSAQDCFVSLLLTVVLPVWSLTTNWNKFELLHPSAFHFESLTHSFPCYRSVRKHWSSSR